MKRSNVGTRPPASPEGPLGRRKIIARLAWTVAAVTLAAGLYWAYVKVELLDDAYISFRYAKNLLAGQGLVFNVGERVEGYTNFLWVILLAIAGWMGLALPAVSRALGAIFGIGTVVAAASFGPRDPERPAWSTSLAPLMLALNGAVGLWVMHGLETAMFGCWLTLAVRAQIQTFSGNRESIAPAFWFALASLTRPEGVPLFAASLIFQLIWYRKEWLSRGPWRPCLLFAALVGAHWIWRYGYYGHLLPNTFYAKVGLSWIVALRGFRYVASFFAHPGAVLFALGLVPVIKVRADPRMAYCFWMLAAYMAAVAVTGGDLFPGYRFLVPICPLLYFMVQEGIWITRSAIRSWVSRDATRAPGHVRLRSGVAVAALAAVLLIAYGQHAATMRYEAHREVIGADEFTVKMRLIGLALRPNVPPSTRIALNAVGAAPYYSELYAYDMLGLTNEHIAHVQVPDLGAGIAGHEKGDGGYILDQRPEIIFFGNMAIVDRVPASTNVQWPIQGRSEREMARDPRRLTAEYVPAAMPLSDGRYVLLLRRRDFTMAQAIDLGAQHR